MRSVPGPAVRILGRTGDFRRFAQPNSGTVFTSVVSKVDQFCLALRDKGVTKADDPGLRRALKMAADLVRRGDAIMNERLSPFARQAGQACFVAQP